MAPAISDNPTMNQFLRERDKPVTQTNMDMIGGLIGKKGSKTTRIPADKVEEAKKLPFVSTNGNGPSGDKPEEPKPKIEEKVPEADPVAELEAWWETIKWKPKGAGAIIKRFVHRRVGSDKATDMVKYRTATGKDRSMRAKVHTQRVNRVEKEGRGFPGYLLDKDTEREGLDKLRRFPGCPSIETSCTSCGAPLFDNPAMVNNHLRDILERILLGFDVIKRPEDVKFRRRHRECGKVDSTVDRLLSERTQLLAHLAKQGDKEEMASQLRAFDEEARRKLNEMVNSFRHIGEQQKQHFTTLINDKFGSKEA